MNLNRNTMLSTAQKYLEDAYVWAEDASDRDKVSYALALSILALHTGEEQIFANEVAAAASAWFASPAGETFEQLQLAVLKWRTSVGLVPDPGHEHP